MNQALFDALITATALRIDAGRWTLGEFELDSDEVDELWPALAPALAECSSTVERVTLFDDGHYESLPFLASMPALEQLCLYGNTLIDDLGALARHPSLRRLALTNYCGIHRPDQLAWLETLPKLEELIILNQYLEIEGWSPSASLMQTLRSLWLPWETYRALPRKPSSRMELLTLEFSDIEEFIALATDPSYDEDDRITDDDMRPQFAHLAAGAKLRLILDHAPDDAADQALEALLSRWVPEGVVTERHWSTRDLSVLNGKQAFLTHAVR